MSDSKIIRISGSKDIGYVMRTYKVGEYRKLIDITLPKEDEIEYLDEDRLSNLVYDDCLDDETAHKLIVGESGLDEYLYVYTDDDITVASPLIREGDRVKGKIYTKYHFLISTGIYLICLMVIGICTAKLLWMFIQTVGGLN